MLKRVFGEVVFSISYFSCVELVKLHLRLEYQPHSSLPLQRSEPVDSSSRSYLFPAQGWNLWSLEGKPSYLITEFFLAWLLVARMQMGFRYSSLDRPLSCPSPLLSRHSALSFRWAHPSRARGSQGAELAGPPAWDDGQVGVSDGGWCRVEGGRSWWESPRGSGERETNTRSPCSRKDSWVYLLSDK